MIGGWMQRLRALWRRRSGHRSGDEPAAMLPPLDPGQAERFAFVTSAYNTPPEFLLELAASIAAQNEPGAEWVLVDNGSTEAAVRECLQELGRRPGISIVRVDDNRGILGGMRAGLEAATREFVMPVDSDDLLAPYTIRALGHALAANPDAKFLFSDEDHFTGGRRVSPFYRTGWDPALALACSYIWHLCAFDREAALRLGAYADPGANYCHDWDTLLRFVRAGHEPVHVPAVLYSWRTHSSSTTNNDTEAHSGSLQSQRHVLDLHLRERGLDDRFVVADCPLWRGAPELRLERKSRDLPDIVEVEGGDGLREALRAALREDRPAPAFAVLIRDPDTVVREADATAELLGWLELLPEVAVVGGRLVDGSDRVVSAGFFPAPRGGLGAPDAGRAADDPGYLAMALKPRVVAAVPSGCVLVRGTWLAAVADRLLEPSADPPADPTRGAEVELDELVLRLCALAGEARRAVVCTPFVTCVRQGAKQGRLDAHRRAAAATAGSFSARGVWHGAHGMP